MFKPFTGNFGSLVFVSGHAGLKPHDSNRIYTVAAERVGGKRSGEKFESHVRYPHLTARDRYTSGVSRDLLAGAPGKEQVQKELKEFLDNPDFILVLDHQDCLSDICAFSGISRGIDLSFAAEFFMPHLDAHSPRIISEHLDGRKRRKHSFAAWEVTRFSVKLVEHICGTLLNDQMVRQAPMIRHYLEKSETLFGTFFLHITRNFREIFGGLFNPCTVSDNRDWLPLLENARQVRPGNRIDPPAEPIPTSHLDALFRSLAEAGKGFRFRPGQVSFAGEVATALNDKTILTIEAGTGTGKTKGYLIPLLEYLYRNKSARAVISTYTKNLQEQIFRKEIGHLLSVFKMYDHIPIALLKGKSSYVCAEKLDQMYEEGWTGKPLLVWLYFVQIAFRFRKADIDGFGDKIKSCLGGGAGLLRMADEISAKDGCTLKHHRCPAQVVTADAYFSRLVVTNHHKLALLDQDAVLSGLFDNYVIDEANHFEAAVRSAFSVEVRSRDVAATAGYLKTTAARLIKRTKGEPARMLAATIEEISNLQRMLADCLLSLRRIKPRAGPGEMRLLPVRDRAFPDGEVKKILSGLGRRIAAIRHTFEALTGSESKTRPGMAVRTEKRIRTAVIRMTDYEEALAATCKGLDEAATVTGYQLYKNSFAMTARPVDVADMISGNFYEIKDTIVFTAATLSSNGTFDSFRAITGMDTERGASQREFRLRKIESPFPADAMEIVVPKGAVNGKFTNKEQWLKRVVEMIPELVARNRGRTLILFSSYNDLSAVMEKVSDILTEMNFPVMVQQKGQSTVSLCEEFRAVKESVLFGVDTFWYGVDFKGDTLTQVIITRIPYPSPFDPILRARKEILSPQEWWRRYRYETRIKLRQGIGRLIRSETDRGKVVILDTRYKA